MRKIVSILLFVALATVLAVGSASAAVTGTAHDMTLVGDFGACSSCHIPHKAPGTERLWAVNMSSTLTANGTVGNLCTACHLSGGGFTGTLTEARLCGDYVFPQIGTGVTLAHKLESNTYTTSGTTEELANLTSTLPYLKVGDANGDPEDEGSATNKIQCTSCHNVHDNQNRPFLRRDIRDICVTCHKDRGGASGPDGGGDAAALTTTWGGGWGSANYGSHPVGTDVIADNNGYVGYDIITFTSEWFQSFENASGATDATFTDGSGVWNLGRHSALGTSGATGKPGSGVQGGVVCVSCHAVHGVQDDSSAALSGGAAVNMAAVGNLLGIEQNNGPQPAGYSGDIYSGGDGTGPGTDDDANFLCESCHHLSGAWGTDTTAWSTAGEFTMNDGGDYSGAYWPNPGTTAYTHPIDTVGTNAVYVQNPTIVTGFGTSWPSSGGVADGILCESCHTPHARRNIIAKARADIKSDANAFLLRDDLNEICNNCHGSTTGTVAKHHPTGNMGFAVVVTGWGREGNGANSTNPAATGHVGNDDQYLTCGDCHNAGSAGSAAHNWTGPLSGLNLDPSWDADSETCENCHYRIRVSGATNVLTPTKNNAAIASGGEWGSETEYQKGGDTVAVGTHFLGDVNATFAWANGLDGLGGAAFNATTTAWTFNGGTGGTSTFGTRLAANGNAAAGSATAGQHLICESCHELEPNFNCGTKLLLATFAEDEDTDTSAFCEGCHGHNPGMEFATGSDTFQSHPLTGVLVTRTGKVPQTTVGSGWPAWLQAPAGNATYPATAANSVTCDSCHQVHDSATRSATFILDGADTSVTFIGAGAFLTDRGDGGGALGAGHITHPRGVDKADINYDAFCQQCHGY